MATENKNVIITKKRRQNLVRASAGDITLPIIAGMAFGDGGVQDDGTVIPPTEDMSELRHELYRKEIDGYSMVEDTTCRYECTLTEAELADTEISEVALYDSNGDIMCIKSFSRKGKDGDLEMTFVLDDVF